MDNPISPATRGWIYVSGIIAAPVLAVVTAALAVIGADIWQPVVAAISTGLLAITATLSRANLTLPDEVPISEATDPAFSEAEPE